MSSPITIDNREPIGQMGPNNRRKQDIRPYLDKLDAPYEVEQLQVGDYAITDSLDALVLVSRKASDLFTSLYDGHLQDEFERCIQAVQPDGKVFFLIEGVWAASSHQGGMGYFTRAGDSYLRKVHETGGSIKALPAMLVSLQTAGVFFMPTSDLHETAIALSVIRDRAMRGWPTKLARTSPRPKLQWTRGDDALARRVAALMGLWPRLSERQSLGLIHRFHDVGAIVDIARQEPKVLTGVKGVGAKAVDNLVGVLV